MKTSITNIRCLIVGLVFLPTFCAYAGGEKLTQADYIEMWKDEAIYQMVVHKIPASITLAQGILESGNGNSTLARNANNHFGIKCHSTWEGARVYHDDDKKGECFRSYKDASQSYEDHSIFLKQKRYLPLYEHKITDYKAWAKGLKKAGYATDPKYAKRLIDLIEKNDLTRFDREGMKLIKKGEVPQRAINEEVETEDELFVNVHDRPEAGDDNSDSELPEVLLYKSREVMNSGNNVQYIKAKKGDNFDNIARDLELMPWQIWKYNDLQKDSKITEDQIIYIKPKRSRAKKDFHTVEEGETLWSISQKYGIKLKKLAKKNGLNPNDSVSPGSKISLKKRVN